MNSKLLLNEPFLFPICKNLEVRQEIVSKQRLLPPCLVKLGQPSLCPLAGRISPVTFSRTSLF